MTGVQTCALPISFAEFVIDSHCYTSSSQPNSLPIVFSDFESLPKPVPPTQQRKRLWAHRHSPYLPLALAAKNIIVGRSIFQVAAPHPESSGVSGQAKKAKGAGIMTQCLTRKIFLFLTPGAGIMTQMFDSEACSTRF